MDHAIPSDLCLGCMQSTGGVEVCPKCEWRRGALAESPLYLSPGTVLKEQYIVGRCLGHGGFGITYLGWDLNLARRIAIKEYFPAGVGIRITGSPDVFAYTPTVRPDYDWGLERYLEEARVVAQFENHPNIVAVKNYFPANGTAYMILEHLDGITFEEFLARSQGKVDWDIAMRVMTPVMDALREVHRVNLLHRDISPDNIFVLWSGQIKVIDFGAARYSLGKHSKNLSVILKPGFAPPEQYETRGDQRAWTDVYAAAATIYRAITGELPLPAPDRRRQALPPPSALGVSIAPVRERALMQALSLEPEDRFGSMEAFQRALHQEAAPAPPIRPPLAATLPLAAPQPSPPAPKSATPSPQGFPLWLLGIAAAVMVLVAAAIFWPRAEPPAPSVEYFRAEPASIDPGQQAELSWAVRDAESVEIDGRKQPATGSLRMSPERTSSYALRAEARGKVVEQSVTVTVLPPTPPPKPVDDPNTQTDTPPPAEVVSFTVAPPTVAPGAEARLTWEVRGATEVKIGNSTLPPSGSAPVRAQVSTRYTLRATGRDGKVVEQQVVLNVLSKTEPPKPAVSISRFEFTPSSVATGGSARLDWQVAGATAVRINNRPVATSGSVPVRPSQSLTAELVAEGPGGPLSRSATLTVQPPQPVQQGPRIISFTATPAAARPGQVVTLSYTTANTVRVAISPEVGNLTSTRGRVTVFPSATTQYALTAYSADGQSVSGSVRVSVLNAVAPPVPQPEPSARTAWRVYHHHGSAILSGALDFGRNANSTSGCYGMLALAGNNLSFTSSNSNDGFSVGTAGGIAEVEPNRLRLGGHRAFHIKLGSGGNYNFVPQTSLDAIVSTLQRVMR